MNIVDVRTIIAECLQRTARDIGVGQPLEARNRRGIFAESDFMRVEMVPSIDFRYGEYFCDVRATFHNPELMTLGKALAKSLNTEKRLRDYTFKRSISVESGHRTPSIQPTFDLVDACAVLQKYRDILIVYMRRWLSVLDPDTLVTLALELPDWTADKRRLLAVAYDKIGGPARVLAYLEDCDRAPKKTVGVQEDIDWLRRWYSNR